MDISDAIEVGEATYIQTEGNLEKALHEGIMYFFNTHPQIKEMARLLLEARDALPAISLASAKLHGVSLSLASRIEDVLEPWRTE